MGGDHQKSEKNAFFRRFFRFRRAGRFEVAQNHEFTMHDGRLPHAPALTTRRSELGYARA